jgi:hypothetical protein
VHRRDDGLANLVEHRDHLAERRRLRRFAEFGDIGPGYERTARASQHDRVYGGIVARARNFVRQSLPHIAAHGIDRGVVDDDDRDMAVATRTYKMCHTTLPDFADFAVSGRKLGQQAAVWKVAKPKRALQIRHSTCSPVETLHVTPAGDVFRPRGVLAWKALRNGDDFRRDFITRGEPQRADVG